MPWVILTVFVFVWGIPEFKKLVDGIWQYKFPVPGLDKAIIKGPPVVPKEIVEGAVFNFNVLSMAGTGILVSALVGAC